MKIVFRIHYNTEWGQRLFISGNIPALGAGLAPQALELTGVGGGFWEGRVIVEASVPAVAYKYFIRNNNQRDDWEWGADRTAALEHDRFEEMVVRDNWRPWGHPEHVLYAAAFTHAIMRRPQTTSTSADNRPARAQGPVYRFRLHAPRIDADHVFCLIGNDPALGEWDEQRAVVMDDSQFPLWQAEVAFKSQGLPLLYKYGVYDARSKTVAMWETGDNRTVWIHAGSAENVLYVKTDEHFRHSLDLWKGAGVAVPVFSLRSDSGLGVGEFTDLKLLADWANQTGLKMIQVLPINDTISSGRETDACPYTAISVFALHPLYLNLEAIGDLTADMLDEIQHHRDLLNRKRSLDYEAVMEVKLRLLRDIYHLKRAEFQQDPEYLEFYRRNQHWLPSYSVFSCLRDRFGGADASAWGAYRRFDQQTVQSLADPESPHHDEIAFHFFVQFHLHRQLTAAAAYCRNLGVVLKGDLPIGVERHSADTWVWPELFNLNRQAGAPPDEFSADGQNWGFPTYHWESMIQDGFAWQRRRLAKLAEYFDAIRIDHVLGYFRIWEIPEYSAQAVMGKFNPALALHRAEIESRGLPFDYERYCQPYIRQHILDRLFEEDADQVKQQFLEERALGCFRLRPEFRSQQLVREYFRRQTHKRPEAATRHKFLMKGLFSLIAEVLFLDDPRSDGEAFHPRIALHQTFSYQELDDWRKQTLNEIYIHYFYQRHEAFWAKQGLKHLPAIKTMSRMLVCGEDLGMVPECVPQVMSQLEILSLSVERMPKQSRQDFADPADCPYLSVCTTSTHDMPVLRAWWEDNRQHIQKYFNVTLKQFGPAPPTCDPWIVKEIIARHLRSPSIWAVFPLQDLLGMSRLRRRVPRDEQINDPSNPHHAWNYRAHVRLEDLLQETELNQKLKQLIQESGRDTPF